MEKKRFYFLVIFSAFLAVFSFMDFRIFFSKLTADYSAVLVFNKTISLSENYTYNVRKNDVFSMLFRNWKAPLTFGEKLDFPFIEVVSFNSSTGISYLKDFSGKVFINGVKNKPFYEEIKLEILRKAENNEVGLVDGENPNFKRLKKEKYALDVNYKLFPPVELDEKFSHINLKLASNHILYPNVKILVKDPEFLIKEIFVHMTDFIVKPVKDGYLVEGSSPANKLIELEFLTKRFPFNGFVRNFSDVYGKTVKANRSLYMKLAIIKTVDKAILLFSLIFPGFIIFFYNRYGREKDFPVPEIVSFIPDKNLKPYVVNMLFMGDVKNGDENGFKATILDLYRRGFLKIYRNGEKGLIIEIMKEKSGDKYEDAVLKFLKMNGAEISKKNIFIPERFEIKVKNMVSRRDLASLKSLKAEVDLLQSYTDERVVVNYMDMLGYRIYKTSVFIVVALLFIFVMFAFTQSSLVDGSKILQHAGILFLQFILFIFLPSQVFGRWRGDKYREKLMWDGFRNFLSNFAMIKRYQPEDISIWKDWLTYATALGVADNVKTAMKQLGITIPDIKDVDDANLGITVGFASVYSGYRSLTARESGGRGGFGAGGGFGGGGAGGR